MSDDRLEYYLGERFLSNNYTIGEEIDGHAGLLYTYESFLEKFKHIEVHYFNGMQTLLPKLKKYNKIFYFAEVENESEISPYCLAKNRHLFSQDGVIVRGLQYPRHWNPYYAGPDHIPWEKKFDKVIWRGVASGSGWRRRYGDHWDYYPFRYKPELRKPNRHNFLKHWPNSFWLDACFIKDEMRNDGLRTGKWISRAEMRKYKFILSIEGNDKDSGLQWKLNSNSVVFMAKPRTDTWLMEQRLVPGEHFVELKDDFSDLYEKYIWARSNSSLCKEISKNARNYMTQFSNTEYENKLEDNVLEEYFKRIG